MYYVFDLDGTLSDDSHREHFRKQEPKDWNAYNAACDKDTPIQETIEIISSLYTDGIHRIEIWTGRTENERSKTEKWLYKHKINYDRIKMRPDNDFRTADILKTEWLDNEETKPDIIFEDRETQVQYWLDAGINVLLLKRTQK